MTHQTLAAKIEEIEKEADSFKLRADDCGKMSRKTSRLISALKRCQEQRDEVLGYARPTSLKRKFDQELLSILIGDTE